VVASWQFSICNTNNKAINNKNDLCLN